ncbi:MAG: hypothetical protein JWM68_5768 [Verrucomicrobiales bacterium]|nr:hypothetical protein [Verrucomicrobiales bacterium]
MFPINRSVLVLLAVICLTIGCAKTKAPVASKAAPTKPDKTVVTPATGSSGRVAMVNKASRFVVLSYALGSEPASGQKLNVYRNNLKVAELKVTGPQSEGNTVADITTGEIQVDDEVRED